MLIRVVLSLLQGEVAAMMQGQVIIANHPFRLSPVRNGIRIVAARHLHIRAQLLKNKVSPDMNGLIAVTDGFSDL